MTPGISLNGTTIAQFFDDGDGKRFKLVLREGVGTENGETVIYVNQYYEKNLTTANVTSSYYLWGRLVAAKENDVLRYVHQDHLTGTSLMTNASGAQIGQTMKYLPLGETLAGSVPTDKKFTGQRLDATGLYYYGARYYDCVIGRFIKPDEIVQDFANPQTLNRYSYTLNNPAKYLDPSGHIVETGGYDVRAIRDVMRYSSYWPKEMVSLATDVAKSSEYQAYEAYREYTSDTLRARTLENSERVISIEFGDLGPEKYNNAKTEKIGDNYEITLNNNLYNNMTRVDDFYVAAEINKQVENNILICYPGIELPNPIELVPYAGEFYSVINTTQKYKSGQISGRDALLSYDVTAIGVLNPIAGLFATGLFTIYNFAQDSRLFYQLAEIYGYPFR